MSNSKLKEKELKLNLQLRPARIEDFKVSLPNGKAHYRYGKIYYAMIGPGSVAAFAFGSNKTSMSHFKYCWERALVYVPANEGPVGQLAVSEG